MIKVNAEALNDNGEALKGSTEAVNSHGEALKALSIFKYLNPS